MSPHYGKLAEIVAAAFAKNPLPATMAELDNRARETLDWRSLQAGMTSEAYYAQVLAARSISAEHAEKTAATVETIRAHQ